MNDSSREKARRWVPAPSPRPKALEIATSRSSPISGRFSLPASTVSGIYLSDDEDVTWTWTHTNEGSYVSGYTIVDKSTSK